MSGQINLKDLPPPPDLAFTRVYHARTVAMGAVALILSGGTLMCVDRYTDGLERIAAAELAFAREQAASWAEE